MKKIVTAFNRNGYEQYGKRFLDSYKASFALDVFTEGLNHEYLSPGYQRDQMVIPGLKRFLDRHRDDLTIQGKQPVEQWNDKERRARYSYRFDAYKFCKMVYTMWRAAELQQTGYMMWLDGDSVIRQRLPDDFFERFLPQDADYCYLGRGKKHTETGFLIFRLPECLPILRKWKDFYDTDDFLNYREWHSAFLFDRAREMFPDIRGHDLTPGGRGHVIHQCDVGKYIDHLKGNRKMRGRSPEAK